MDSHRFMLRKEYFGGILHDVNALTCEVLSVSEYAVLARSAAVGLPDPAWDTLAPAVLRRAESAGGAASFLAALRAVPPARIIPQNCLTAPIRIYDTFTRRCNLNCPQCCAASNADFAEARRSIAETILIMRKFYEAGTPEWRFTGGEPTSCADLPGAIAAAKGMRMGVMLNTNGCWNEQQRLDLPASGLDEVIISMEGREEVNDQRRNAGTFRKSLLAMDAIDRHNRRGGHVRVTINMTVARDNVSEVPYVVRIGAERGYNVNFVPLRPYGRTPRALPGAMMSTVEFHEFSRQVQCLREDPAIKASGIRILHRNMDLFCPDYADRSNYPVPFDYSDCGALSTGFGLCPDGRVNACSFLMDDPDMVGPSMLQASVQEAWLHPKMEMLRRAVKTECKDCRFYKRQCEGKCRAMVLAEGGAIRNGKLLGRDRYCHALLMDGGWRRAEVS